MVAPKRTAHAICKHLSSNFKPKLEIGKACSQSEEFFAATASNLALSLSVVAEAKSLSYLVLHKGRFHSFWLEVFSGSRHQDLPYQATFVELTLRKGWFPSKIVLGTIASTPLEVAHTEDKYAGTATLEAFLIAKPPILIIFQ